MSRMLKKLEICFVKALWEPLKEKQRFILKKKSCSLRLTFLVVLSEKDEIVRSDL